MKKLEELQPFILEWAKERNILFPENAPKQRLKLIEECGELAQAILKNDIKLQKDAIGDVFVVLVILAEQINSSLNIDGFVLDKELSNDVLLLQIIYNAYRNNYIDFELNTDFLNDLCLNLNLDLTECANIAWNEIKDRKGKTINGTFIKQS